MKVIVDDELSKLLAVTSDILHISIQENLRTASLVPGDQEKIYMPVPQLGRGDRMGRGPYEKSGLIEYPGLPPDKMVHERFEIPYPLVEVEGNGKTVSKPHDFDLDIEVQIWCLPFGSANGEPFLWWSSQRLSASGKNGK